MNMKSDLVLDRSRWQPQFVTKSTEGLCDLVRKGDEKSASIFVSIHTPTYPGCLQFERYAHGENASRGMCPPCDRFSPAEKGSCPKGKASSCHLAIPDA